jgi:hypothetical protein
VAKIAVARIGNTFRIRLRGRLTAGDLKRLERACGLALQQKLVPLELDIGNVTAVDDTAQAYLNRLLARGASIRGVPTAINHTD